MVGPGVAYAEVPGKIESQAFTPNNPDMLNFNKPMLGPAELPHGVIKKLRVQKITDPRCPDISDDDLIKVLLEARKIAKKQLGLEIMFNVVGDTPLQTFFLDEDSRLAQYFIGTATMFSSGTTPSALDLNTIELIRSGAWRDFLKKTEFDIWNDDPKPSMEKMLVNFATAENKNIAGYYQKDLNIIDKLTDSEKKRLLDNFKSKQQNLKNIKGTDNKSLLDPQHRGYFSSNRWRKLLHGTTSYDFVITNTPLLDTSKHFAFPSFTRGGVLNGFIASIKPPVGVISAFPLLSDADFFREKDIATKEERNLALATIIVHELGHQILGLEDDFTGTVPLMNPPHMFQYKKWYKSIEKAGPAVQ